MRRLILAAVTLIACVRAAPRPEAPEPTPDAGRVSEAATFDAGLATPTPDAGRVGEPDAGLPTPDFRSWVAPRFGAVPPAAHFAGCHDPTPGELAYEKTRHRIALGRALEAKGLHLLEVRESFTQVAPGEVVRGPNGERLMGVLTVERCGPRDPPLLAVTRDGAVVPVEARPKAARSTTVAPCTAPRTVCPPGCGARPPPTFFVAEVPPGATRRYEVITQRYALDEAVVFTPIETWRNDCPPPP